MVAGSWSSANLTGGFVSAQVLPRLLPGAAKLARELVDVGLWTRTKSGYLFHDWADFQPTKEEAAAARQKKSVGANLGNHRRWHADRGIRDPECPFCLDERGKPGSDKRSDSDQFTAKEANRSPIPPSRPQRGQGRIQVVVYRPAVTGARARTKTTTRSIAPSFSCSTTSPTR
ncbi:hypothetical protein GCM10022248_44280 [Nonomuraea soli]